jgi:beta-glucosidase
LKGFAKAKDLAPGATQILVVKLGKYAVSIWDVEQDSWRVAAGRYEVQVGTSSENLPLKDVFELKQAFSWKGL